MSGAAVPVRRPRWEQAYREHAACGLPLAVIAAGWVLASFASWRDGAAIHAGEDTVARALGTAPKTARNRARQARAAGWFAYVRRPAPGHVAVYRLTVPRACPGCGLAVATPEEVAAADAATGTGSGDPTTPTGPATRDPSPGPRTPTGPALRDPSGATGPATGPVIRDLDLLTLGTKEPLISHMTQDPPGRETASDPGDDPVTAYLRDVLAARSPAAYWRALDPDDRARISDEARDWHDRTRDERQQAAAHAASLAARRCPHGVINGARLTADGHSVGGCPDCTAPRAQDGPQ